MEQDIITAFAEDLVKNVRDRAIKNCDVQLHTENLNSPIAARWEAIKRNGSFNQFAEMLISDVVDSVLFSLLNAIDDGSLPVFIKGKDALIDLADEGYGELGGSYMAEWRSKFSKERCYNDLLDR